ncbi:MAG: hypothetical protein WKF94_09000 [Solirubrobacteraceae bacterium]
MLGHRATAAWLTTWLVLPEERRHQTATKLLLGVLRDHDGLVGTLGGNDTTLGVLGRLRFETEWALPRWIRPLDPDAFATLLEAAGQAAGTPAKLLPVSEPPAGIAIRRWAPDDAAAWDRAWTQRFAPRLVGTARDAAHLRWRYVDHPRFDYTLTLAWSGETPVGLLVHRVQRVCERPESVVRIVELLGDDDAQAALLGAMLQEPDVATAAFADLYGASPAQRPPMGTGFVADDAARPVPSLFAPLDNRRVGLTAAFRLLGPSADAAPGVLESGAAYVTRSDCDQDRPN